MDLDSPVLTPTELNMVAKCLLRMAKVDTNPRLAPASAWSAVTLNTMPLMRHGLTQMAFPEVGITAFLCVKPRQESGYRLTGDQVILIGSRVDPSSKKPFENSPSSRRLSKTSAKATDI